MRKKSDFILRFCLIVGDALALILSFAMAYFVRVHVDPRPYAFESQLLEFTWTIAFLVPIMLVILAALGLYKKSIFLGRSRFPERMRLVHIVFDDHRKGAYWLKHTTELRRGRQVDMLSDLCA